MKKLLQIATLAAFLPLLLPPSLESIQDNQCFSLKNLKVETRAEGTAEEKKKEMDACRRRTPSLSLYTPRWSGYRLIFGEADGRVYHPTIIDSEASNRTFLLSLPLRWLKCSFISPFHFSLGLLFSSSSSLDRSSSIFSPAS